MLRIIAAAVAACLFVVPAVAQQCMKWEDGVKVAARYSHDKDDRVAAVLLTQEETAATWAILTRGKSDAPPPARLGVMVAQSTPETAFIAGFDENGCLVGKANVPFGPLLDAMVTVGVKSVFVIIDPAPPEAGA